MELCTTLKNSGKMKLSQELPVFIILLEVRIGIVVVVFCHSVE